MNGRHDFFANEFESEIDNIRALTKACVDNQPMQVKEILKDRPHLVGVVGPVFDHGKRYENVTVFQYALHANKATIADAIMMLTLNAKREDLLTGLKSQFEQYLKKGITFTENSEKYTVIPDADHALQSRSNMIDLLLNDMKKPTLSPGK